MKKEKIARCHAVLQNGGKVSLPNEVMKALDLKVGDSVILIFDKRKLKFGVKLSKFK